MKILIISNLSFIIMRSADHARLSLRIEKKALRMYFLSAFFEKYLFELIIRSILHRSATHQLLKHAAKMLRILKAQFVGNFAYRF